MPLVCGVRFRGAGKVYHFAPGDLEDLEVDDQVVVETARGAELAQVAMAVREIPEKEVVGELKSVVRRATNGDLQNAERFRGKEDQATETCRAQAARLRLDMKVVSAEYSFDGSRLTFFFTAEQRVDFRELVRELARDFRTRIELRQIGVRDEARIVGGLGKCGRVLCCKTWLNEFSPVSIRMAKQQDLPLSPMEISGQCGRLLCCLGYENEYYRDVKGKFPKVGKQVDTPLGQGKVVKICVLREMVTVLLEDGSTVDMTADQLSGAAPLEQPRARQGLTAAQESTLDAAIGTRRPEPRRGRDAGDEEEGARQGASARPSRARGRGRRAAGPGPAVPEKQAPSEEGEPSDGQEKARRSRRRPRPRRRERRDENGADARGAQAAASAEGRAPAERGAQRDEGRPAQGEEAPARRRRSRPRRRRSQQADASPDNE
ncbi:MAG: stage 0 sporulation family protein [Chloroflexi bacterium]|nr:stage 0 sporulation family protein [Chloroflexota bacterium]